LFRATSAHGISTSRAFPSQPAAAPLDARCSLAVGLAAATRAAAPVLLCSERPETSPSGNPPRLLMRRQGQTDNIIRIDSVSKPPKRYGERSQQPLERDARALTKAPLGSVNGLSEAGSNRHKPRLQSLTPAESPFSVRQSLDRRSKPMLSWPFSPPRLTRPVVGLSPSPPALTARPTSTALRRERPEVDRLAALQGVDPTDPERNSEEILQPP
jgi:hypothetical protein